LHNDAEKIMNPGKDKTNDFLFVLFGSIKLKEVLTDR
jgi:hypothetical protein